MKDERNTGLCILGLLVLAIAAAAGLVYAEPNAPTTLDPVQSSNRDLSGLAAQSASAQGGNVTEINIEALTVTKSWQGYYGNVTGTVILQDGNNNTFYNWSMATYSGRVFATRSSTVDWGTVNCTNATARAAEETYLSLTASDSDSVTNTYNKTTHPEFVVGNVNITADSCFSTNGYVNNASQNVDFVMVLLNAGSDIVYTTLTNKTTTGFDGRAHDFELLVGENEKTTIGVTQYYFWTEFS